MEKERGRIKEGWRKEKEGRERERQKVQEKKDRRKGRERRRDGEKKKKEEEGGTPKKRRHRRDPARSQRHLVSAYCSFDSGSRGCYVAFSHVLTGFSDI